MLVASGEFANTSHSSYPMDTEIYPKTAVVFIKQDMNTIDNVHKILATPI